ncbi:MAG: Gfo/Idh/MocA family oxidoreductase [Ruminococcaceae bacterium]|nr:Gfo/Idh/MocA family oxidoreductase [Oscillospiraceae bacterium]
MANKLKVAIVGCGSIARGYHLPAYGRLADIAEVVAVCDIVRERAQAFADRLGLAADKVYTAVEDLLAKEKVDYIDCCTWPSAHAPVCIAAANAGVNILCEKPLAATLEQGLAIEKAVKENGVNFQLAVVTRYGAEQIKYMEMFEEGVFGEIYAANTQYIRRRGIPGGWFSNKEIAGGGPVLDIGVHAIDRTWYLMGRPKPVSVSAEVSTRIGKYKTTGDGIFNWDAEGADSNFVFDVEDSAIAFFRFEGGKTMVADVSWTINGPEECTTQLYGTKAGCTFEPFTIYGEDENNHLCDTTPEVEGEEFFTAEIRHFIGCINENKTPISNIDDAVTVQRMLDGIYRSAEAHREIAL